MSKVWKVHKRGTPFQDAKKDWKYKDVAIVFESVLMYDSNMPVCTLVFGDCVKVGTKVV